MEKLTLLINELVEVNKKNMVKSIIREIAIFVVSISVFFTKASLQFKLLIFVLGCFLGILGIILESKKKQVISFCVHNYKNNKKLVIDALQKRKSSYSDIFDFVNERLLFMEILRVAKCIDDFKDEGEIGPWKLIYSKAKTEKLYKDIDSSYIDGVTNIQNIINKLPLSVRNLLKTYGVNYMNVYDIWTKSLKNKSNTMELMYPIAGIILNDSQVLRKGLRNKEYELDGVTIKPYEREISNESVVMLHIRISL